MKNNYCRGCGAPLRAGVKICPQCGRIVPTSSDSHSSHRQGARQYSSSRRAVQSSTHSRTNTEHRNNQAPRKAAVHKTAQPRARREARPDTAYERHAPSRKRRITAVLFRTLTVAVVIAAIYFALFFVQVTRIKLSGYDFDSEMTMTYSNYGQAIENYFDDGSWSYNPFTFKCTYTGTSKHNEEYEIVFTAKLKIKVSKMTVDGDEYTGSAIESRLMAMFI